MYLSELFSLLSTGEFSTLYIGGEDNEGIPVSEYPTVINHINLGLTDLHTRFPLKEKEVIIQQYDNITLYRLNSIYGVGDPESTEDPKYILDTEDNPFANDIIRIERAHQEDGTEVPLNDYGSSTSWFTPSWDTVQIPNPVGTNTANFIYRAMHPKLVLEDDNIDILEVDIPYTFVNALLMYVASRQYSSSSNQDTQAMAMSYNQKYEYACSLLEKYNVANDSDAITNVKLELNGWV